MPNEKKPKTYGYQPLQEGYQPNKITGKIKPPKGGTGETTPKNSQGTKKRKAS